jgi:hypothetical protein
MKAVLRRGDGRLNGMHWIRKIVTSSAAAYAKIFYFGD